MRVNDTSAAWRFPVRVWFLLSAVMVAIAALFYEGLVPMWLQWVSSEEYGYGPMIPAISIFLIWQMKNEFEASEFRGSWSGLWVVLAALFLYFIGELSTLYIIIQYAFVLAMVGIALCMVGWAGVRKIWAPLFFLLLMIPLPNFLYQTLSANLQLISSEIGVSVIRLFGISVYLEGNVIDLGSYKLQVVEACSGLRYLFPLVTLSFITAYFFKVTLWKRVFVFLSSIPITVLMNSFRIGVIGVLVEYWGPSMAEGFLHDFEGWLVFMACLLVLLLEMWLLLKIGKEKKTFSEAFSIELPSPSGNVDKVRIRSVPKQLALLLPVMVVALVISLQVSVREEIIPDRAEFDDFPVALGDWVGHRDTIEKIYIDVLKFDDYLMANYRDSSGEVVNFYVAYYGSQRKGAAIHSPRSCIPGGGWKIDTHSLFNVPVVQKGKSRDLKVNRLLIKRGEDAQLVYYWFDQRGRLLTNEYLLKWYLFWDSIVRNRTDGALVRVMVSVPPDRELDVVELKLMSFVQEVHGAIDRFVPD